MARRPIVSVAAAPVLMQSMPIWVTALGTVTPHSYVNVMPRVAGLLQSVNYREGPDGAGGTVVGAD